MAPILDCSAAPTVNIQDWACVFMLNPYSDSGGLKAGEVWDVPNVEYLGLSSVSGSACSTTGGPGTAGPLVPVLAQ